MTTSFQVSDLGKINEADFTTWFLDACDLTGWRLRYHTFRSKRSQPGFPDWTIWHDGKRALNSPSMMLVELKGWNTPVDDAQVRMVNATRAAGVPAYIWRPRHASDAFRALSDPIPSGMWHLPPLAPEDYAK